MPWRQWRNVGVSAVGGEGTPLTFPRIRQRTACTTTQFSLLGSQERSDVDTERRNLCGGTSSSESRTMGMTRQRTQRMPRGIREVGYLRQAKEARVSRRKGWR